MAIELGGPGSQRENVDYFKGSGKPLNWAQNEVDL